MSAIHPFFETYNAIELTAENFDEQLEKHTNEVCVVFFWGHDCPNCDVAKKILHQEYETVSKFNLRWFHINVYENMEIGTRFGLFGIPVFIFFHKGKNLGRITTFPGLEEFLRGLQNLQTRIS